MSTPNNDELNKYGVSVWLIEALKSYDGVMAREDTKGRKMKAKRELEQAINQYCKRREVEAVISWIENHVERDTGTAGTIHMEQQQVDSAIKALKDKENNQHRGSVETLALSGHGDTSTIIRHILQNASDTLKREGWKDLEDEIKELVTLVNEARIDEANIIQARLAAKLSWFGSDNSPVNIIQARLKELNQ